MTTIREIKPIMFEAYGLTVQHSVGYNGTTYGVVCRNRAFELGPDAGLPSYQPPDSELDLVTTLPGDDLQLILAVFVPELLEVIRSGETDSITAEQLARVDRTIEYVREMDCTPVAWSDYRVDRAIERMTPADRFRELIENDPRSVAELSRLAGFKHPSQLSQIKSGHRGNPSIETVEKLLGVLGRKFADLDPT